MKYHFLSIILMLTLFITSCDFATSTKEHLPDTESIAEEAIEDFENYRLKLNLIDSHVLEFPSPVEMAANYKNSGMNYIPGITNPSKNHVLYETHTKKALNFGVYSADLSYCVLNDMGQCSSEYLLAMSTLSETIGLTEILRYEVVATQFMQSIGDRDSLIKIVSSIQDDLDATLRKNGIQDRAILFYAGAWVESAYIAFHAQESYSNTIDTVMLGHISDQLDMLSDINYELSIMPDKTQEVIHLQEKLKEFESLSSAIRIVEKEDSIVVNANDIAAIRNKVTEIRDFIIH